MIYITKQAWGMRWTILFAIIFGYFIAPTSNTGIHSIYGIYDSLYPVVKMYGTLVQKSEDFAVIHIKGEKLRECKFIQLDSYSRKDGYLRDTSETRADLVPQEGTTKPLGTFDIGNWKVWPIKGADAVLMYTEHDCGNRVVITKIAEVSLL